MNAPSPFLACAVEHGSPDYLATVELRREVLRKPLGLDFTPEDLAAEKADYHLAIIEGGKAIACLVLSRVSDTVMRMRQVAVDPGFQSRGYGRCLVHASARYAALQGCTEMTLHARESAVPFYRHLGYETVGQPFEEVGIPHLAMWKSLL